MKSIYKQLISASALTMMFACSMVDNSDPELIEKYEAQQQAVKDSVAQVEQEIKDSIAQVEQEKKDSIAKVDEASCPESFMDNRDSSVYDIVRIYDASVDAKARCWFKQNLNYKVKNSFCLDDENSNCRSYGRLYLGDVLKTGDICPEGSRVSSYADWKHLFSIIDPDSTGKRTYMLKAEGEWVTSGDATKAMDSYKFSALPGGVYDDDSETYPKESKDDGAWWVYAKDEGIRYLTIYANSDIYDVMPIEDFSYAAGFGFSIRCVLNSTAKSQLSSSSSENGDITDSSSSSGDGDDTGSSSSAGGDSSDSSSETTSSSTGSSSSAGPASSSSVEDEDDIVVSFEDVTINGNSQKGPFVQGTTISVFELENGHNLIEKGSTKTTEIKTDDGKFAMSGLKLKSQFVRLGANGYFRNELTGKASTSQLELKAVADLTRSKTININLMTHLEYYRVKNLVTNDGFRVNKAKIKADKEIFSNFFIDSQDFETPDKLSVVGPTEGDAALLAISALFLGGAYNSSGEFQEALLTELLAKFSDGVEKTGTWDNDSVMTVMADWAAGAEMKDHFKSVRDNVKAWGLGEPANFEKYLTNFWTKVLKVDDCSSDRNGTLVAIDGNSYSRYYSKSEKAVSRNTRLVCKAGKWEEASTMEKDTYRWESAVDGKVVKGDVTDTVYVYDGAWRFASDDEKALNKGCTTKKNNKMFVNASDEYFLCLDKVWTAATEDQRNTYNMDLEEFWAPGVDGKVKVGEVKPPVTYYVFDELGAGWRKGDANDYALGFGGCTVKRRGLIQTAEDGESMYVCDTVSVRWNEISSDDAAKYGRTCKKDGDTVLTRNGRLWICDMVNTRDWRLGSPSEQLYGACVAGNQGETVVVNSDETLVCDVDHEWVPYTFYKKFKTTDKSSFRNKSVSYKTKLDARDGKTYATVVIDGVEWMAENLNYYKNKDGSVNKNIEGQSWCYGDDEDACRIGGRLYSWTAASNMDSKYLTETLPNLGECLDNLASEYCSALESEGAAIDCNYADFEEVVEAYVSAGQSSVAEKIRKDATDKCYSESLENEDGVIAGICPSNFRLPTKVELENLLYPLDPETPRDNLSAYPGMWPGSDLSDKFGTSFIPSGIRTNGAYKYAGEAFAFWTAGQHTNISERAAKGLSVPYRWDDGDPYGKTLSEESFKTEGYSVRCVRYKDDNGNSL